MAYPTHCCCMTVRTGTKVLAILNVIGSLSGLIGYAVVAVNYKDDLATYDKFPEVKNLESAFGRVLAYTVICAIGLIVAILCVRGAFTDERLYILPYLVFHAMVLVVLAILFFIMISTVPSSTQRSPSIVERLASIRTASPLIGSLSGLIGYAVVAVNYKDDMAAYDKFPEVKNLESAFGRVLAYTVICAIGLIVAILCVRGAFTDERLYILPYLVFHAMVLVVLAILFFIMISTVPSSTQRSPSIVERLASIRTASPLDGSQVLGIICSLFVSLCIGCYFFVVVLSFYKHLTNAANKSAIGMVPAAQSLYPGTYVPPRSYSPVLPAPQRFSDSKTSLV